jgi:hypothetical protein
MESHLKLGSRSSLEQPVVVALLVAGLYFPTSINGEHSVVYVLISFLIAIGLLSCLVYVRGTRPGAVRFLALPLMIVMISCTLLALVTGTPWFDSGSLARFCSLAVLLSLNLKDVRVGRVVESAFTIANLINLVTGAAILVGSDWISRILSAYYSQFYPELVSNMIQLHKPVLTFGTHSLAGFFLYLFFLLNWETYKKRGTRLALWFAVGHLVLLVALSSFTAIAFSSIALCQITAWLWRRSRARVVILAACFILFVFVAAEVISQLVDWSSFETLAGALLNTGGNGPLARYGSGGTLVAAMGYLYHHPFSPMGFTVAPELIQSDTPLADSGPLEYVLRGSWPALILIYLGLYRFLRFNLVEKSDAVKLFLIVMLFETGFSALNYIRSFYLLPFIVIYLNSVARAKTEHTIPVFGSSPAFSVGPATRPNGSLGHPQPS